MYTVNPTLEVMDEGVLNGPMVYLAYKRNAIIISRVPVLSAYVWGEILTHEIMHAAILDVEGLHTSMMYDNIALRVEKDNPLNFVS